MLRDRTSCAVLRVTESPMRALWLEERKLRMRVDVPPPTPPPGEALVRVRLAGICNTDLELVRGYYPFIGILGHEFVGVVETGPDELTGRRVVGEINAVCGECRACRGDRRSHCEDRTVLGIVGRHGAFAEYLTLPVENLHVVPDNVSDEQATFTEPLAAALKRDDYSGGISLESVYRPEGGDFEAGFRASVEKFKQLFG